jgi:hypothetical protein
MFQRIWQAYQVTGRVFGAWLSPLLTLFWFLNLRMSVAVGMLVDPFLFSRLPQTRVERPIVIVGNPRTGTTFLHRFLVEQRLGAGMELWRMLHPSLALQTLLRPLLPLLEKLSPARHHSTAAHRTSLTSVETDDAALFFRYFDGFFLYGFLLAWAEQDCLDDFDPARRDTSARDFAWLETVWRRNLIATGGSRVVAKLFSIALRLPQFLQRFPDARILYLARDPVTAIPSSMSLVTGVLERRFGFWNRPEAVRRRYLERLYQALIVLLRRFHDDYQAGLIDRHRILIVPYERLMSDFEDLMAEILAFLDVRPTPALLAAIAQEADTQRRYQSEHQYDLARFGLKEEQIRRDCAFVYEGFLRPANKKDRVYEEVSRNPRGVLETEHDGH